MKIKSMLLALTCLAAASSANAEVVVVPATGYGDTFEQAVESALGNAVKQVNGATVATQSAGAKVYAQVKRDAHADVTESVDLKDKQSSHNDTLLNSKTTDGTERTSGDIDGKANASSKTTLEAGVGSTNDVRSQGKVKSYSVVKQVCTEKGCTVDLSVSIEKIEFQNTDQKLKRDSIAVLTVGRLRNSDIAVALRRSVTEKLVKGGRFTVLDRTNDAAFDKENDFLSSDNVSDQQRVRLGQAIGADYMLIINLAQAGVSTSVREDHVDLTGESSVEVSHATRASLNYTLVQASTRAVKWSDSVSFSSSGNRMSDAMEKFQDKIAGDIAEIVNPPKVVAVQDGKVIINRGTGIATNGQVYDIFALGEALVDPDTGESLGAIEKKVASIKISDVHDKVSYGDLIVGQIALVIKGSIARVAKASTASTAVKPGAKKAATRRAAPKKSDQNIDSAGGVVL
jgi:Rieske Fe-S protein